MKPIDTSRKEDHQRVLHQLEVNTAARIEALTLTWEVVRVTPTSNGLQQEVIFTLPDEEEAERYARISRAFPPTNADYYIKPWGTPLKKGAK